ncbi:MAG: ankyrin repeat domain-containing protein [Bacteroidota bacterium]
MKNKIYIIFLLPAFLSSCSFYLPGYNFALFNNSPVEELAEAVEDEDLEEIEEILKENKSIVDYQEPKFGNTVLMLAVANNKNKSARKLLQLGANPNTNSKKDDKTPLIIASNNFHNNTCNTEIVKDLIHFGADVNFVQHDFESNPTVGVNSTALLEAASSGKCFEIVKLLVENGANINYSTQQNNGSGAVMLAIVSENLEIARYLLVEKHAMIPRYIYVVKENTPEERLITITDVLNDDDRAVLRLKKGPYRDKLKQEILDYLQSKGVR